MLRGFELVVGFRRMWEVITFLIFALGSYGRVGAVVFAVLFLGHWQSEKERRPGAEFTLGTNAPAVGLDNVLHNREAETCTAGFAGAGFVYAIEAFEDAPNMF